MKSVIKIILLQILLINTQGFIEIGSAQNTEHLHGQGIDEQTRLQIPGATVFVEEQEKGVAANSEGRFTFENLLPGSYTLHVRSVGYTSFRRVIEHPNEEFLTIELRQDILQAEEIIITSSPIGRNIQYQPAQAINREALQQKAAPSLGEILDGNPGVSSRSFGSAPSRPIIRGLDGDRVLVLQNGERMGDLSGTAVDHAVSLDPLSMDRVEVIRGPAKLLYGSSAIGGVVNLFSNDMPREWDKGPSGSLATHVATVNDMGAALVYPVLQTSMNHFKPDRNSI